MIRHVAVFEPDKFFNSVWSMRQQSCNVVDTFIGDGLESVLAGLPSS